MLLWRFRTGAVAQVLAESCSVVAPANGPCYRDPLLLETVVSEKVPVSRPECLTGEPAEESDSTGSNSRAGIACSNPTQVKGLSGLRFAAGKRRPDL